MALKGSEYTKSQDGEWTVFTVTPAQPPKFWYLIIFGGVVCAGGLLAGAAGIAFILMGGFALWYGWTRDLRPKPHRKASSFKVSADAIDVGGQKFSKSDVHRVLIRNAITDQELDGVSTYTSNSNVAAGMAFRAQSARGAHGLQVETGGKATLLAGGMDETTSYGLLHDVCKVLDFKIS